MKPVFITPVTASEGIHEMVVAEPSMRMVTSLEGRTDELSTMLHHPWTHHQVSGRRAVVGAATPPRRRPVP
jgi:hypothetical protein